MKNPYSTITGIALAIVSIISAVGLITSEQAVGLTELIPTLVTSVGAIISLFKAKDGTASITGNL
jgi:hypothetical protein